MRLTVLAAAAFCAVLAPSPLYAQEVTEEEQDVALREDPWTHLVVTLKDGKKITYARTDILKVQYLTRKTAGGSGTAAGAGWMGRSWKMRETAPDGRYCDAVWTRQGSTNKFSGQWTCSWGARVSDTLVVQPLNGRQVVVYREGVRENYRGTLSADGRSIRGTNWGPGSIWTVSIE